MNQYLNLVRQIFEQGSWHQNRTGVRTLSIPGAMMRFDLQEGFPAVTTKRLAFKSAIGEMVGFLRASRSAAEFRELGCKVWDQNANENKQWLANPYREGEDDLGPVYGVQWRKWPAYKVLPATQSGQIASALEKGFQVVAGFESEGVQQVLLYKAVDQLRQCLDSIMNNPSDRRILFHGWNWAQLDEMALPPCHCLFQFYVADGKLSLQLYQRSADTFLGVPFNIASYALLLQMMAQVTGFEVGEFIHTTGDTHLYLNHLDQARLQLTRTPRPLPRMKINPDVKDLFSFRYEDFELEGYDPWPHIAATVSV